MRSSVALMSAAVLAMSGVLVAPGTATATDPTGQVLSATADPGPFTVTGFAGQAQSVITVVVDEPRGTIGPNSDWYYTGVQARLTRTSGGPTANVFLDLPRVSGSGSVGTYSAPWRIASSRTGTWTLTRLAWDGVGVGGTSVDPRVSPGVTATITVVGTGAPTATVERIPTVVPYRDELPPYAGPVVKQWARVTYRTSAGTPIVGATVVWGHEYPCNPDVMAPPPAVGDRWGEETTLRTDSHGQVTVLLQWDSGPGFTCLSLLGPPAVAGGALTTRALVRQDFPYPYHAYKWVSAVPATATVRLNRTLTVTGAVAPSRGVVRLQKLVGRTWRTLASAPIRSSGRYTVYALVTTLGYNYLRVVALNGDRTLAPTPSRVFVVKATPR